MKLFLFPLFFLFSIPISAYSQDTAPKLFNDLQRPVRGLKLRFEGNADASKVANAIGDFASALQGKWEQSNNREVSPDYLKTLRFDSEVLARAENEPNKERAIELLGYVHDDLKIKVTHSRKIVGATGGLGAIVRVTVKTTTKAGQDATGFLVRCNPRRFADMEPPMFVFNNETNPTTVRNLPPGNYEMWLERPSRSRISSKPITVGGSGETSEVITFEVP